MKKIKILIAFILSVLAITACDNDNESQEEINNQSQLLIKLN